jgi:hypothetical protein
MWKSALRTAAVLILGAFAYSVGSTGLSHLMQPKDFVPELRKAMTMPANSPEWPEIMCRLHHAGDITVYIAHPLAGLMVGVLVALAQKRHAVVISLACIVPESLSDFLSENIRNWAKSPSGIIHYLGLGSLPLIAAIAGAMLTQWLIRRGPRYRDPVEA